MAAAGHGVDGGILFDKRDVDLYALRLGNVDHP
jgi:hypothetical protein